MIEKRCEVCNKIFKAYPSGIKKGNARFCSKECFRIYKVKFKRLKKICIFCKKEFSVPKAYEYRKHCSMKCYGLSRRGKKLPPFSKKWKDNMSKSKKGKRRGSENPNWRGGRRYDALGYVMVYAPNHPFAMKSGCVYEHRLIVEKRLCRYLKPHERVHHINEIKNDNRPENLMYFHNESKHQFFHGSHTKGSQS